MKLVGFESVQMKRIEILETYKQRLLTLLQYVSSHKELQSHLAFLIEEKTSRRFRKRSRTT